VPASAAPPGAGSFRLAASASPALSGDAGMLARSLPIARAAWPDSPCAGHETIRLRDDAAIAAMSDDGIGFADPAACTAGIASGLDGYSFCVVLVHELGHLAGREHSNNPRSVMYATPARYPPCRRAFPALSPMAQAKALIRDGFLPAPRARWRIACTRPRGHHAVCTGASAAARATRSFAVTIDGDDVAVDAR
jgi:hypothetical protein